MISSNSTIMLDSGAYTAYTKGAIIDIDKYIEFIKKYEYMFKAGFINLDVIGDEKDSYYNWRYMIKAGVDILPVYHLGGDEKYLVKYMHQTDSIAIGGIASMNTKRRMIGLDRIWKKYLLDDNGIIKLKVHGLGVTSPKILQAFPWTTVDSSKATKSAAYGKIVLPTLKGIQKNSEGIIQYRSDFHEMQEMVISSQKTSISGATTAYLSLPKTVKEAYADYIHKKGYTVSNGIEKDRILTKSDKRLMKQLEERGEEMYKYTPLFKKDKIIKPMERTSKNMIPLDSDWNNRLLWNLDFWKDFNKVIPTPCIYHVASSKDHLGKVLSKDLPILISYYHLQNEKGALMQMLLKEGEE